MSWVDDEYYKARRYSADDGKFPFYDIMQIGEERRSVAKILKKIIINYDAPKQWQTVKEDLRRLVELLEERK